MKSHFIDINVIFSCESKAWIVDKDNPNIPITKIDPHEFNLFKSGIFMSQGNKLSFNGHDFWLPTSFMNLLKIKAKNYKSDVSNLGISLQEFMNKDVVDNIKFHLDMSIFNQIINTNDDVYIICSKNTKRNFDKPIKKLESDLKNVGIGIKGFFYVSETFYNVDEDDISYKKVKIILEHLIGLKIEDSILNEEIVKYDQIIYWDDNKSSISLANEINDVLESLLLKSEESIRSKVSRIIKDEKNSLIIREFFHNKSNKYRENIVDLIYSNTIRGFK